ncbi:alpha-1,4-glucan--maltose-1-phosphate maltosyltransferase [Pseudomonas sp. gcc21]|uniref:alpha-1,4-glucan--maltose-1-phosphate maltosyltransferase n=1 Tax=Pseudomonas sp. gcc21 TaxID=2726989 RepID=UPI001451E4A5|nr:alpha-1,4-glucan--maltose-1-phosphate maltosyltransferase [Pseudomonas sp. gcc21]QJD60519.1 alpha-1,4-glucan--maltose-1-phosphate maltosyltransferase [Pseudomonas sp. gcc21]
MSSEHTNEHSNGAVLSLDDAVRLPRIAIERVQPQVEAGRFAAKAIQGRPVEVSAVVFSDGHDKLGGRLIWRSIRNESWQRVPLEFVANDVWRARFVPDQLGRMEFAIEAWVDTYATYCDELKKKFAAGVPVSLELEEGEQLLREVKQQASSELADVLDQVLRQLAEATALDDKVNVLLAPQTVEAVIASESHPHKVRSAAYPVEVDRRAAEFASWYELFPRSVTDSPERHGTFRDVIERLPDIAAMNFDVLYFPPIHPIGRTHRKGPNNSLIAGENDPGSPYAIGSHEGGHEAIHPQLGTFEDFRALVEAAQAHKLEIALDFAIQCSPDHPWLQEHPGWFSWRPDGTIRHAENPPKKYEDIVNVDFYADDAVPSLWVALRDVVMGWVELGVKMFRVDNPHTKPMPFWEWLIADIRDSHPDVIFLSEAFTRPPMMARLGKLGFSQSYTYFTWRNTKQELQTFFTELNQQPWRDCYRPNFFVNTPDINPYFLHESGRAGFLIRAALATMGAGSWGMYSGFEICEAAPVLGKEEYLDSEKYEIRPRDYYAPGNIVAEITHLNRIRRANPALQTHLGFQAYTVWNDNILYFGKRTEDRQNFVLVAISMDPHNAQEAHFELPLWEFGLPDDAEMVGEDLMTGHTWTWYGKTQWMRIEPWAQPFGIWRLRPLHQRDQ